MSLVPDNYLKLMSPEDRRKYAKGQLTKEEAIDKAAARDEKLLRNQYMSWLSRHQIEYCHAHFAKRSTINIGLPDFHVWKGSRHCFIEFKSIYGRLSKEQADWWGRNVEQGIEGIITSSYSQACKFVIDTLGLEILKTAQNLFGTHGLDEERV